MLFFFQNLKHVVSVILPVNGSVRVVIKTIMVHSIINNTAPEYLTSRLVRRCDLTSYNL